MVEHHLDCRQLSLKAIDLLGIAGATLKKSTACRRDVGDIRTFLQLLNLSVNSIKFIIDQRNTIIDKFFSLLSDNIFIVDNILVVDRDKCVDYLLGSYGVSVGIGDVENRGDLVDTADIKAAFHTSGDIVERCVTHIESHIDVILLERLQAVDCEAGILIDIDNLVERRGFAVGFHSVTIERLDAIGESIHIDRSHLHGQG